MIPTRHVPAPECPALTMVKVSTSQQSTIQPTECQLINSFEVGCVPNSISPATWIPGFSDSYKSKADFMCAIAITDSDLIKRMEDGCCKGPIQQDGSACYHWCKPKATDITGWATCISDKVYTDTGFGQSCNAPGGSARESAEFVGQKPPAGTSDGPKQAGIIASWKLSVLLGVVGLVQAIC
jgi:hypothetical protein